MPNWCEGTLKVRGRKENILKFIKEGTSLLEGFWNAKEVDVEVEIDKYGKLIIKNIDKEKDRDTLYIKGTTRHFIEKIEDVYIYDEDEEEQIIYFENFKVAWGIDTEELRAISERYNIDFKVYAFERGMEFNQDIEIIKGKIIKDDTIRFENYTWQCIEPSKGG